MKVLLVAPGSSLAFSAKLGKRLVQEGYKVDFYIADSSIYFPFVKKNDWFNHDLINQFIFEWDLMEESKKNGINKLKLKSFEELFCEPLQYAVLADRRIYFGSRAKSKQDYNSKFNKDRIDQILSHFLTFFENYFKSNGPSLIISFGVSTIGEYLLYNFSKLYGVPYRQIKSSKINDLIYLSSNPIGVDEGLSLVYNNPDEIEKTYVENARVYINKIKVNKKFEYEGAIISKKKGINFQRLIKQFSASALADFRSLRNKTIRNDNHVIGYLYHASFTEFINPIRWRLILNRYRFKTIDISFNCKFLFYAMHFEPEVSLQINARDYLNQIEFLRNISNNLPTDVFLVVKEHPRSYGYRSFGYYRQLFNLKNVLLANPKFTTSQYISSSLGVITLSGSVGLESMILHKPLYCFGNPGYKIIKSPLINSLKTFNEFYRSLKRNYSEIDYDKNDKELEIFFAAFFKISIPCNLYTGILGKKNRISFNQNNQEALLDKIFNLTNEVNKDYKSI